MWFDVERMGTPEDPSEPFQFNRMEALKTVLFDFFADHETSPSKLFYKEMVSFTTKNTVINNLKLCQHCICNLSHINVGSVKMVFES